MPSTMRVIVVRSSTTSTGSPESTKIIPFRPHCPWSRAVAPTHAIMRAARRPSASNLHDSFGDQVAGAGHAARLILMSEGIRAPALRFYGGQANDIVRSVGGMLAPGCRNVKPASVGERLECVGQAYDGLGGPKHKVSVVRHLARNAVEHCGLGALIEIDQHVPAKHHVECAQRGEIVKEVDGTELHHAAQFRSELPGFANLVEIFDQQLNRQPTLNFKLGVDPGLRLFKDLR